MSDVLIKNHSDFIWSIADLLRGDYKQSEYGKVILPLVVIRRLDCVLEPTKSDVLAKYEELNGVVDNLEPALQAVAQQQFFNTSPLSLAKLLDDPDSIADSLNLYIGGFSAAASDVIEKFDFSVQVERLKKADVLYQVVSRFAEIDLHPNQISNIEMGYLYEELIRKFSELSNETAGEHFTPREVIHLMVNLLFIDDADEILTKPGIIKTLFDPACGTGGMLSVAEDHLRALNSAAQLEVFGQELNAETYAICRSDMMLKGQDASHIAYGNSFSDDHHSERTFDYMLANPPFGVEWKKVKAAIEQEAEKLGFKGRFGAGLPRIKDGSFLFLQHMISKMKSPEEGGSRIAIVFNGSPLFTGGAGSGESEIRRWIIENDWLEAVVALPDQLFYNTGIFIYFWVVTNRKSPDRRGKVQLLDAREFFEKMDANLGEKRKVISNTQIDEITQLYGAFEDGEHVKIFPNEAFGSQRITVERPLKVVWSVTESTITAVEGLKLFIKLDPQNQASVRAVLESHLGSVFGSETDLKSAIDPELKQIGLKAPALKTLRSALMVRDLDAPVQTDSKGKPRPDPEARDSELVPQPDGEVKFETDVSERLKSSPYVRSVEDYFEAEVIEFSPDAWVDFSRTRVEYQIPITRHFYKSKPQRSLSEIDAEIQELENEAEKLIPRITR